MTVFLGKKGEDVLARRNTAEFIGRLKHDLFGKMSDLPSGEELTLLRGIEASLDGEMEFEAQFAADFMNALEDVNGMEDADALSLAQERLGGMIAGYFHRRGSVPAHHVLCTVVKDRVTGAALRIAERWMAQNGFGSPPVPWCWLAVGDSGRMEASLYTDCDTLLIHAAEDEKQASYFVGFSGRAATILDRLGMTSHRGIAPSASPWRGSIADWRRRLSGEAAEREEALTGLMLLADLRLVSGNPALAAEMVNLVRAMLEYHREPLREAARRAAMMPVGFDFFGRLKVEKGEGHQRLFNIGLYGIEPMVAAIRILTVRFDVPESSTADRIRGLLHRGHIDVDLAERLLYAYHNFHRHCIVRELEQDGRRDGRGYVDIEKLTEDEELEIKGSLEAVSSLQKIIYSSFSVQG